MFLAWLGIIVLMCMIWRARRIDAEMTLEHIVIVYFVIASMVFFLGTFLLSGDDMQASGVTQFDRAYLISRSH